MKIGSFYKEDKYTSDYLWLCIGKLKIGEDIKKFRNIFDKISSISEKIIAFNNDHTLNIKDVERYVCVSVNYYNKNIIAIIDENSIQIGNRFLQLDKTPIKNSDLTQQYREVLEMIGGEHIDLVRKFVKYGNEFYCVDYYGNTIKYGKERDSRQKLKLNLKDCVELNIDYDTYLKITGFSTKSKEEMLKEAKDKIFTKDILGCQAEESKELVETFLKLLELLDKSKYRADFTYGIISLLNSLISILPHHLSDVSVYLERIRPLIKNYMNIFGSKE